MSAQLAQILGLLSRPDIAEVAVQSGKPVLARQGTDYKPLTQAVLSTGQIEGLIRDTAAAPLIPAQDGSRQDVVDLFGSSYTVTSARRGDIVLLRFSRGQGLATGTPVPAAAHVPAAAAPVASPPPRAQPAAEMPAPMSAQPVRAPEPSSAPRPAAPSVSHAPSHASEEHLGADLTSILQAARRLRASDVHVMSDRPVHVRTAGALTPRGQPLTAQQVEHMLLPNLNAEQKEALAERGYVDMAISVPAAGRVRANIARQKTGLKGSFRLVMDPVPTIEALGLPQELHKLTTYHQGLIVIAGPNGHGKTTTLAALVDLINSTKKHHVLTVEEPVEFIHERKMAVMSQREVGQHTKSFATALKASLREDPDVIVIGELRDRETVEIAITAAETGHLVMATMSTPSGAKTIDRIIDFFPPGEQQQVRYTLAAALKFVVAQRLVPTVDNTSFLAAVELITGSPPLWTLIRDNKLFQLPSLQQRGRSLGMIRLDESLMKLLKEGKISEETALTFAENRKEFMNQLHGPPPAALPVSGPGAAGAAQQKIGDLAARARGMFGKKEG